MSVKEPWDSNWKTNCRSKIRGCDGFIAMLSNNTHRADGARWEITCALEERVPILGVHIRETDLYVPPELSRSVTTRWTWYAIAAFINGL